MVLAAAPDPLAGTSRPASLPHPHRVEGVKQPQRGGGRLPTRTAKRRTS